jgi:hypothetical protein
MAEVSELNEEVLQQLPEDFQVQIAALDDDAQTQVIEAVQAAADEGALPDLDIDDTIRDAAEVSERQDAVETLHREQAEAVESGDFERAQEISQQSEWEMREIEDHGGDAEQQLLQAERDQVKLDDADWESDTAAGQVAAAADMAESGDLAGAATQMDLASGHAETAADYAGVADQGGTQADHSYDSAASTGGVDTTTTELAILPRWGSCP